ncbi:PIN domain-containing protein [Streptomyces sp. NBC_00820]|uniref:PIN domain-containing protein n=1 Tax=Streptomyces sp. NBC_00820 TaxID=2975842 RepID=UPI002ED01E3E|nr:PIN domain-containing protein [Streptomyces sp. NBC_00820]
MPDLHPDASKGLRAPLPTLILDTCVVTTLPWNSTIWELFRAVRTAGLQRIAIPEMVLMELLAQRSREYDSACKKAYAAHEALWKLQFVENEAFHHFPAVYSPQDYLKRWEEIYRTTLEVLPLSREAAVEGLRREAYRLRPARANGKGAVGSRDAAIWMTVLEQAKGDSSGSVCFVSKNTDDFGPNGILYPDMAEEVKLAGLDVEYLTSLDEALNRISRREVLSHDDPDLTERLSSLVAANVFTASIYNGLVGQSVAGAAVDFDDEDPFAEWETHWEALTIRMLYSMDWRDEVAYSTGTTTAEPVRTLAATLSLFVGGEAQRWTQRMGTGAPEPVAFAIDVRILMGPHSVSVASVSDPRPFTSTEEATASAAAAALLSSDWGTPPLHLFEQQEEL